MHETTSQFFAEEYLAPIVGIMLFSCCVLLLRIARRRHEMASPRSVLPLRLLIVVGIVTTALTGGHTDYLGAPGWRGSIAGLKPITSCVRQYSRPDETVFAMYLEEVVFQSQRRSVPGVSLGSFSYEDLSTAQARSFRMLNHDTLIDLFRRTPPKVLVLTVFDFDALSRAGWFSRHHIDRSALNTQFLAYRPVCQTFIVRNIFINMPIKVDVYVRNS